MGRTEFIAKNSIWGIVSKLASLILGFASRTLFIYFLGITYLGVNGLYSQILQMLSLAELGFGTALTLAMYRPVAQEDDERIVKLLYFYKGVYRIIAAVVTVCGILLLPFLQYIVKGADELTLFQLRLYFVIFLTNTVINYFVSYKYSYVNALQKNYIITNFDTIANFSVIVIQIIVMIVFKDFLAYLLAHTFLLILSRFCIALYLNKKFPILCKKTEQRLSKEEKKPIYNEIKGLALHQFSSVAIHSTDNIIISSLSGLGVVAVGLISNYNLIMTSVTGFIVVLFNSVTSSFGNLVAVSDTDNYHKAFLDLNFINFWMYGFCSIAFFVLVPPFIKLWLGEQYLIDGVCFLIIVLNTYFVGQSTIYNNARMAKGEFSKDKYWALAQALVNLVVSIIGARLWGLIGVYIGTILSRLLYLCGRPYSTYKTLFNTSCLEYYKKLATYFLAVCVGGAITYFATLFLLENVTLVFFIIAAIMVLIIPNVLFLLFFCKTIEFRNCVQRLKEFVKRRKSGNEK